MANPMVDTSKDALIELVGEDYYNKYLADLDDDTGLKGAYSEWLDFSYNKVPETVDNITNTAKNSFKWVIISLVLVILIIYRNQIKRIFK